MKAHRNVLIAQAIIIISLLSTGFVVSCIEKFNSTVNQLQADYIHDYLYCSGFFGNYITDIDKCRYEADLAYDYGLNQASNDYFSCIGT